MMVTLSGAGVGYGAGEGAVVLIPPVPAVPADESLHDPHRAAEQIGDALASVGGSLLQQASQASGPLAETLTAAATMAADPALAARAIACLDEGVGPATAVDRAVEQFAQTFRDAGGYLAERVSDLTSVRDRVIARLLGRPEPGVPVLSTSSVIVARDLAPADTAALDLEKVAGIVTAEGGPTSHTAIIARQLGIPCVVGVANALDLPAGGVVLLDAATGVVVLDPTSEQRECARERSRRLDKIATDYAPATTRDGHRIQLLANIGTPQDARRAVRSAADGVGLFRTEVLFLDRTTAPSRSEQAATYREVLEVSAGRKVVLRTLDAGADKPLAFASLPQEANPALGQRGYRTARLHPELLEDQLAAIATAASDDPDQAWVMAPMVSTSAEAGEFASRARAHGIRSVGVMVEVPAAALLAEQLLEEVDFLSIGTNDLAQYVMAADRLSADLHDLTDPWQPAILGLVNATARAGQQVGKPVGVCGESAADPLMALVLTGMGVTSLSMSAPSLPAVRYALRGHGLDTCRQMAAAALAAQDAEHARAAVVALADETVRADLGL